MKKHLIWSNRNLDIKDWEDGLREHYEINGLDYDAYDESDHDNTMWELNNMYLDDERCNLDIQLHEDIIVIADLGLWHGRRIGYKIIESGNIKDCLYDNNCIYCEWYVDDEGELRFYGSHHDGTNHYFYRVFKSCTTDDERDDLMNALYHGRPNAQELTSKYTERLGDYIGDVYGWAFPNRKNVEVV